MQVVCLGGDPRKYQQESEDVGQGREESKKKKKYVTKQVNTVGNRRLIPLGPPGET